MDYSRKDYYSETISAEPITSEFDVHTSDGGTTYLTTDGRRLSEDDLRELHLQAKRAGKRINVYVGHPAIRKEARRQAQKAAADQGEASDGDVARMVAAARKRDRKAARLKRL